MNGANGNDTNSTSTVAEFDRQRTSPTQLTKRPTLEKLVSIHDSVAGTFESHRYVENSHRSKFQGVESTPATGGIEVSDKLQYPVLSDPMFASVPDASWANRKDFGSQCGYLCVGTEWSLLDGRDAPCCPISCHSSRCPTVAHSSGSAETQAAAQSTRRDRIHSTSVTRTCARWLRRHDDR